MPQRKPLLWLEGCGHCLLTVMFKHIGQRCSRPAGEQLSESLARALHRGRGRGGSVGAAAVDGLLTTLDPRRHISSRSHCEQSDPVSDVLRVSVVIKNAPRSSSDCRHVT